MWVVWVRGEVRAAASLIPAVSVVEETEGRGVVVLLVVEGTDS